MGLGVNHISGRMEKTMEITPAGLGNTENQGDAQCNMKRKLCSARERQFSQNFQDVVIPSYWALYGMVPGSTSD